MCLFCPSFFLSELIHRKVKIIIRQPLYVALSTIKLLSCWAKSQPMFIPGLNYVFVDLNLFDLVSLFDFIKKILSAHIS